jgi:phage terminase large subunit-like protein
VADNIDFSKLSEAEKSELLTLLQDRQRQRDENQLAHYVPYKKQREFHERGGGPTVRERLLMAGNQLGKTWSAGFETAMHLTGIYPDWWIGKRFNHPTIGWAASITSQGTRDTVQRLLLGRPGEWGTGAIPKECIVAIKRSTHGVSEAVESILVKHVGGGQSSCTLKTYDQGRARWQGETLDFVWFDEEPPLDLYSEGLTRTNATGGFVFMTFTPLLGMSEVVKRFLIDKVPGSIVTTMTIEDAEHYTPAQRKAIILQYPEHERKARAHGIPMMGSGMVFPVVEEAIRVEAFQLPSHWPRICGIDFGWDHPFGAAWLAYDPDADCIYVTDCYRVRESTPAQQALVLRAKGCTWMPTAWPHDGLQHDKGSGEELMPKYKTHGVNMLKDKASHPPSGQEKEGQGGNSVEVGLLEMLERMQSGRFKVFAHLADWWEEFRLYHRKDGKLVKLNDDILSATRYAVMMRRHAKINQAERPMARPGWSFGMLDSTAGY